MKRKSYKKTKRLRIKNKKRAKKILTRRGGTNGWEIAGQTAKIAASILPFIL